MSCLINHLFWPSFFLCSGGVGCAGAGVGAEWVVPVEEMMVVVVGSVMKVKIASIKLYFDLLNR